MKIADISFEFNDLQVFIPMDKYLVLYAVLSFL